MQELLTLTGKDPKSYTEWFDLDFTKYPVGDTTGFTSHGLTFNRTTGTGAVVLEDGEPAMSFNGDGALSAGTAPDMLLDKDWKISMRLKIKAGTSNPMIFVGRSIQANGSGTWIANMLGDARLDWWYGGPRVATAAGISRGVWHDIVYESVSNRLTITVDGSTLLSPTVIPDVGNGTPFNLVVGGSGDTALYHSRCFMRYLKIETKKR